MPRTVHDILAELADVLEPIVVPPATPTPFATTGDWTITLPGTYSLGVHSGHVIVQAPDVNLVDVDITGTNPDRNVVEVLAPRCTFKRTNVHGGLVKQKRGIFLQASDFLFEDGRVDNIIYPGNADTQAIGSSKDSHNLVVRNSVLEAAGEVVMSGGDRIGSVDRMNRNWLFENVTFTKRAAWRGTPSTLKNIFELKAIDGCVVRNCVMEYAWVDGQTGFGIVLTVRNQYGDDPFANVKNVLIEDCTLRHCAGGVNILGRDNLQPSGVMENVTIRNLKIEDISSTTWGGNGRTFQITGGPKSLTLDGVTVAKGVGVLNSALMLGAGIEGLVVKNCTLDEGQYGIFADGTLGAAGLAAYAPGCVWEHNTVIKGGVRNIVWPAGTTLLPAA